MLSNHETHLRKAYKLHKSSNVSNPLIGKNKLISATDGGQDRKGRQGNGVRLYLKAVRAKPFQQWENKQKKRPCPMQKLLRLPNNGYGEKLIINFLNITIEMETEPIIVILQSPNIHY